MQFKDYSSDNESEKFKEGNQLDNLFLNFAFQRDFYRGRLGSLNMEINLNEYNLNYFENKSAKISYPFNRSSGNENNSSIYYNTKNKLQLNVPKTDLELLVEYNAEKILDIDNDIYFKSTSKIKTDIEELEGIIKSLGDYKKNTTEHYHLFKPGKFSFMGDYTKFTYKMPLEDGSYITDNEKIASALSYKDKFTFYLERETKNYTDLRDNTDKKSYKLGFIDIFGNPVKKDLKDFTISGIGEYTKETYKGREYSLKSVWGKLEYEKYIHNIKNKIEYRESGDKYSNDTNKGYFYNFDYTNSAKDLSYYFRADYSSEKVNVNSFEDKSLSLSEINSVLSNTLIGSGSIVIQNNGNQNIILDITNIKVDGDLLTNPALLLNPGESYKIGFTKSVSGSIILSSGDVNELEFFLSRTSSGNYNREASAYRAGYYLKMFETFKSKLDLTYSVTKFDEKDDPENNINNDNEYRFYVDKSFEIRPFILIFDKQFRYSKNNFTEDNYDEYFILSKDGFYTLNSKFYMESSYSKLKGDGYDEKTNRYFLLFIEKTAPDLRLAFFPKIEREKEENNYTKKKDSYEFIFNYKVSGLRGYYEKEDTDYVSTGLKKSEIRTVDYQINLSNFQADLRYRFYVTEDTIEQYSANLKFLKYKVYPVVSPYVIFEIGYERSRDNSVGHFETDEYINSKITYTPTTRLEAVFSFEKQIDKKLQAKGIDYELVLKYRTRVFNMSLGYRKNETIEDGKRRREDVVYFQILKSFDFLYRTGK